MTLQTAAAATTASNAASIQPREVVESLTMNIINSKITTESERTDLDERTFKITLEFDADINGRTSPVEIIQSDASRILIKDLEAALVDVGFRVSHKSFKTRDGKNDKIRLQVAWG